MSESHDAPARTPKSARAFDVVVFGATGFTGRLVAEYMHNHGPKGLRWAIAGRDQTKLDLVKKALGLSVPILIADAKNKADLRAIARQTRVVCTTVGPYALHGEALVAACAAEGTDYADITGEVQFIREMIDLHHETARNNDARIVHCCGFDSIPSDLGVLMLAEHVAELTGKKVEADGHVELGAVTFVALSVRGGFSGGTVASMLNLIERARSSPALRRLLRDPYSLTPDAASELTNDGPDDVKATYDDEQKMWLTPFLMGPINTRIVRRSNALLGHRYGKSFGYTERMRTGRGRAGAMTAYAIVAGTAAFMISASSAPLRALMRRVLPAAGEGPSKAKRDAGSFKIRISATTVDARALHSHVTIEGQSDPGYGETAKMLSEAAFALAFDAPPNTLRGVLTPATGIGLGLVKRLQSAGMRWDVLTKGN